MFAPSALHHEMRRFRRQMDHLFHEFDRNLGALPLENDPFFSWNDQMLLEEPRPNLNASNNEIEAKEAVDQKKQATTSAGSTSVGSQMAVEPTNPHQGSSPPGTSLSTSTGQQSNALRPWGWGIGPLAPAMSLPRVDIVENADNFLVNCDLPGVAKDDVKVQVTPEGMLSIQGEHSEHHEKKDDNTKYHRIERSYGKFKRSLQLPANVDADAVKAKHENGLLQITLPKKPKAEPKLTKHIPIH